MFNAFRSRLFIRQFVSFFLLVMLTFTTISGTLLFQTRRSLERQDLALAESFRRHVEQTLSMWLEGVRYNLRSQARLMANVDERMLSSPMITAYIREQLAWNSSFLEFVVVDADGWPVNTRTGVPQMSTANIRERSYFQRALAGESVISGFLRGIRNGRPILVLAEPIGSGGKYVMLGVIDLDTITGILLNLELGEFGQAFLVDIEGRLLADGSGTAGPTADTGPSIDTAGVLNVQQKREGTGRYRGVNGESVFGSYSWLDPLGAGLLLELSETVMMRPLFILIRTIGVLALLFLVTGSIMAFLLARSVLYPVNALIDAADSIMLQDYRNPLHLRTKTELDNLVHRFNAMQEAIRTREMMLRRQHDELLEQKAAAEAASRLKSQFLSNITHELKTPLNVIIGFSTRLLRSASNSLTPTQQENLDIVRREANHLLAMINDLLDYSKIEAGRMETDDEDFDLILLAAETVSAAEQLTEGKPVRIRFRKPGAAALPCRSDRKRVRQILLNLLSNAVKYSERGTVTLSIEPSADGFLLAVEDEGVGIERKDHDLVFEEFRQLDGSSRRKAEGTGLGLSITKRLTELLGGRIHLESEPGKGSRFTVFLPGNREQYATKSTGGG